MGFCYSHLTALNTSTHQMAIMSERKLKSHSGIRLALHVPIKSMQAIKMKEKARKMFLASFQQEGLCWYAIFS